MGPLAALERFFERLFERQTARLFRTKLQPIQLQRRVERAMESGRVREGSRTSVPSRYAIHLAPEDLGALRDAHPSLAADLADFALAFARGHGYHLPSRPTVGLVADRRVTTGDIRVEAGGEPNRAAGPLPVAADGAPAGAPAGGPSGEPAADERPEIDRTALFVVPAPSVPRVALREIRPNGSTRSIRLDGRPLTIGRAPDNGLVLHDSRASRRHARLFARSGVFVLADLGSTNGSFVNDRRVEEMPLGEGDRIRIGDTILVLESVEEV
jgi:FHA domain-containing protein